LFRGLMRETGRPVEGHVEAVNPDEALKALSDNAIVTESLTPDPKPLNLSQELPDAPELANALESAFDASSAQVAFDDLTERYRGKKVWVIDRDKIRRRVCQVVDQSLAQSAASGEGVLQSRQRVQAAIQGMFADNRNIATERSADSIPGQPGYRPPAPPKPALPRPAPPPQPAQLSPDPVLAPGAVIGATPELTVGLEDMITRLQKVVGQAEKIMASMALAARNLGRGGGGGGGGGGGRRRMLHGGPGERGQNEVLLEIFKANLDLAKMMTGEAPSSNGGAAAEALPAAGDATAGDAAPAEGGVALAEAPADELMDAPDESMLAMEPDAVESTGPEPVGTARGGDETSHEAI
jgi:hypothetical protein